MTKKKNPPLGIFIEAIGLYFSNFDKFLKYMTFPVLGQIIGLVLTLIITIFYAKGMPNIIENNPELNNFTLLLIIAVLITIPGMAIFMKAFWEYLVAYGAINSMLENMLKSGKVYDFDAHTELIKRRTIPFVGLWFLFGLFSALALIPFLWVPCAVFAVFFVLVFQVFTYEPELSPIGCVRKSLILIKGHFASTFMLMALAGALTYVLIPQLACTFFEYTHITELVAKPIISIVNELPVNDLNNILAYLYIKPLSAEIIALFFVTTLISQIFIQYTLPLRSILWGMWYRELNGNLPKTVEKKKQSRVKKPSEKLMDETHKKYSAKKLDRNLLRRAMEKDEE